MDGWKNRRVNALYGARGNSLFDQPMKQGGGLFDMTTADVLNTPIARGNVLPLTEYVNRAEFDTDSGLFGAIKRAATAPGRAYSGQIPEGQMLDEGMNFAGMLTLGGYMGAPLKPSGALGMGGGGLADQVRAALLKYLSDEENVYGLRVTKEPLEVGKPTPPSRQWYQDKPEEGEFLDHGEWLAGPSTVGVGSEKDIERALRMSHLVRPRFDEGYYPGGHVSIVRGSGYERGVDPGEWILHDAETVLSWPIDQKALKESLK